jgi:hypothetical protein
MCGCTPPPRLCTLRLLPTPPASPHWTPRGTSMSEERKSSSVEGTMTTTWHAIGSQGSLWLNLHPKYSAPWQMREFMVAAGQRWRGAGGVRVGRMDCKLHEGCVWGGVCGWVDVWVCVGGKGGAQMEMTCQMAGGGALPGSVRFGQRARTPTSKSRLTAWPHACCAARSRIPPTHACCAAHSPITANRKKLRSTPISSQDRLVPMGGGASMSRDARYSRHARAALASRGPRSSLRRYWFPAARRWREGGRGR